MLGSREMLLTRSITSYGRRAVPRLGYCQQTVATHHTALLPAPCLHCGAVWPPRSQHQQRSALPSPAPAPTPPPAVSEPAASCRAGRRHCPPGTGHPAHPVTVPAPSPEWRPVTPAAAEKPTRQLTPGWRRHLVSAGGGGGNVPRSGIHCSCCQVEGGSSCEVCVYIPMKICDQDINITRFIYFGISHFRQKCQRTHYFIALFIMLPVNALSNTNINSCICDLLGDAISRYDQICNQDLAAIAGDGDIHFRSDRTVCCRWVSLWVHSPAWALDMFTFNFYRKLLHLKNYSIIWFIRSAMCWL